MFLKAFVELLFDCRMIEKSSGRHHSFLSRNLGCFGGLDIVVQMHHLDRGRTESITLAPRKITLTGAEGITFIPNRTAFTLRAGREASRSQCRRVADLGRADGATDTGRNGIL